MSSTNNLKMTCPEYWVEDEKLTQIRKSMDLAAFMSQFSLVPVTSGSYDYPVVTQIDFSDDSSEYQGNPNEILDCYMDEEMSECDPGAQTGINL